MRGFLTDILLFCCLLLALLLGIDQAYNLKLRSLRIGPGVSVVICGDSHTQSDLSDSAIAGAVNVSQSGEHLLYTFRKLALILHANPGVNTVVLGVSYHTFSAFYDGYVLGNNMTGLMYPQYFPMLDYRLKWFLVSHDPDGVARSFPAILRSYGALVWARRCADYPFWGYYYRSDRNNLNAGTVADAIQRHYYEAGGGLQGFADYQVQYLERIIRLCAGRHIRLVLVNPPVSPQYAARVPGKFIANYQATIIAHAGAGVRFLDYHDLKLPAQWYGDGDHLNARGAAFFSALVATAIKDGP